MESDGVFPELDSREALLETVRGLRRDLDELVEQVGEERAVEPGAWGPWTFKDLIAHLTGWRLMTAARLEAGLRDQEPQAPWPDRFTGGDLEEGNVDDINEWFYQTNRDKPLAQVLQESNEAFDRVEQALQELPEDALFQPGRFAWMSWSDEGLGPAVIRGTYGHYHVDHKPDIEAWLGQR